MQRTLFVLGTRPEAIKLAPVIRLMREATDKFDVHVCITAQHRKMLDQVLELFEIPVNIDLNLMTPSQGLAEFTSSSLTQTSQVISRLRPDLVVVHGDTSTTLSAALASFYHQVRIAHIEAGLRTQNLHEPFPEEFNRQVVSKMAALHFAPTDHSKQNLIQEQVPEESIFVTGNTVIDALFQVLALLEGDGELKNKILTDMIKLLNFDPTRHPYILVTGHRRENYGEGIIQIAQALIQLSHSFPSFSFVYPVHLNPRVLEPITAMLGHVQNIHLIPPQDYLSFVFLLQHCYLVLTDSGGIQEEAPSLGKPVLLMRETTERPEALTTGAIKLVGCSTQSIFSETASLISDERYYNAMRTASNPFGNGTAANQILDVLSRNVSKFSVE